MINMHDWDPASATWATPPRFACARSNSSSTTSPFCARPCSTSNPPGGRGQGLHQDEQYITTDPLIGLWIALDPSDAAVGQMIVVPGSHGQLRPVEKADTPRLFHPRSERATSPEPQSSASTWPRATASSSTAKPSTAPIPTRPPTAGGAVSSATTSANAPSTLSRPKAFTWGHV